MKTIADTSQYTLRSTAAIPGDTQQINLRKTTKIHPYIHYITEEFGLPILAVSLELLPGLLPVQGNFGQFSTLEDHIEKTVDFSDKTYQKNKDVYRFAF